MKNLFAEECFLLFLSLALLRTFEAIVIILVPVVDERILACSFHLDLNALDSINLSRDPEVYISSDFVSGLVVGLVEDDLDVSVLRLTVFVVK